MTTTNHNRELHHFYHVLCRRNRQRFTPCDEAALCYDHYHIYEAKIVKAASLDDENTSITGAIGPQYYVHYKGWKEKWNEWVPAERLLKKIPQNLRLQASLKAAHPHLSGARHRSGQVLGRSGDKCQEDGKEEATRAGN